MLKEALELHNHLNPALWDKNQNLLPEVDDRLHKIVNKFQSECMLPLDIVDVHLVGSNASFNYNSQSDLDVHIIVNFDLLDVDKEILTAAYNLQKAQFNRDYDISIHGVNIEMYIEDINSMTASNGIYSLYNKKWIKKPVKKSYPTLDKRFYDTLDRLADKMRKVVSSDDEVEITKNINMLYMMRKNGLATDGEFSIGNLLFKEIRNLGLLDELKHRLKEVQSERLTLETLNESVPQKVLSKALDDIKLFSVSMFTDPDETLSMDRPRATYILSQLLGRPEIEKYHLHHINHLKSDNNIENLCLIPDGTHNKLHKLIDKFLEDCFNGVKYDEDKEWLWRMERNNWIPQILEIEFNFLQQDNNVIFLQTIKDKLDETIF